ncbi:MAG: UTP--glucose-1-phosphate uridylyltransferase GalU [Spirochaetales bacterium]|nr:UTP--glucose-1-phosphate uridylyltransferase GalU [Spirochaetales bacterium]
MVKKAVIPAAGFGTRFLPATKSQPKEMLPIVDTPTIQYVVQEAIDAGITDILLIIGRGKRTLEEYFSKNYELEDQLREKKKQAELDLINFMPDNVAVHFIWQHEQNGLGDAVRYARHHVGDEPFAVLLGDTVLESFTDKPVIGHLIDVYDRFEEGVFALEEVAPELVSRYGVIDGEDLGDRIYRIGDMVEKPAVEEAPSNLVVASRYVLPPEIFTALDVVPPGKGGEIQLTDALRLIMKDQPMYGYKVDGIRHDMGNKLEFLKTNIHYGLKHKDLAEGLKEYLKELVKSF